MADITAFTKLTHLWPAQPSRSLEQSGIRKKPSQQRKKQNKKQQQAEQDGPGKNIDEYA